MTTHIDCLNAGFVKLLNLAGPTRRIDQEFDANDVDVANAARISFNNEDKERTDADEHKLNKYLYKNKHTSPFEMIETWWEMKLPIFVARQLIRHRTAGLNEMSGRYTPLPNEFYVPRPEDVGVQSKSNKQARDKDSNNEYALEFIEKLKKNDADSYKLYEEALDKGIPKEIARGLLSVGIYTRWVWKMDLKNLMHFLMLRTHGHAQYEIRVYANAMYDMLKERLPNLMEIFDEHGRMK
jgi:thymidylate synthase (FAD)